MKSAGLMEGFSKAEIEAGRRLFAGDWNFASAASSPDSLPPMAGPEIAFAGRSNVGKSSLINALTGRRALARTSNTPGRTQELIFFNGPHRLVGGRHAGLRLRRRSQEQGRRLDRLITNYLHGRATLGARLPSGRRTPWAQRDRRRHSRHAQRDRGQPPNRSHQVRPDRRGGTGRADGRSRGCDTETAGGISRPDRDLGEAAAPASPNCARRSRGCSPSAADRA